MESILVSLVASVPPTIMALCAWRRGGQANASLGQPNGKGTVVEMLERQGDQLDRLEVRFDRHIDQHLNDRRRR